MTAMRLNLRDASPAELLTLPLYPVALGLLGGVFLLQDPRRTDSPPFAPAKGLARFLLPDWLHPMQWWGIAFLAVAAVLGLALLHHLRVVVYLRALGAVSALVVFWMILLLVAAWQSTAVSYSSAAWLLIPAVAPMASARQLARRRRAGHL